MNWVSLRRLAEGIFIIENSDPLQGLLGLLTVHDTADPEKRFLLSKNTYQYERTPGKKEEVYGSIGYLIDGVNTVTGVLVTIIRSFRGLLIMVLNLWLSNRYLTHRQNGCYQV